MSDDQFWAVMTHKRDEGLAHITDLIERSGPDEFAAMLAKHVMPMVLSEPQDQGQLVEHLVGHMAIVGAIDAMLAWKESKAQ